MEINRVNGFDQVSRKPELKVKENQNENEIVAYPKESLPDITQNENKDTDESTQKVSKTFSMEAFKDAVDANKGFGFNMVGRDSSLDDLDIDKAISDMQKDEVLRQYQYFVKNSKAMIENTLNDSFNI